MYWRVCFGETGGGEGVCVHYSLFLEWLSLGVDLLIKKGVLFWGGIPNSGCGFSNSYSNMVKILSLYIFLLPWNIYIYINSPQSV